MIQIEESNPSFESCHKCIHSDDSEETCILRQCIHAVAQLKECYVPKQPTIEPRCETCEAFNKTRLLIPQRKKGKWIEYDNSHCECPFCHEEWSYFDNEVECFNYCPNCGAEMLTEDNE